MEALVVLWLVMMAIGAWASGQKHRNPGEGVLLVILLGPLGLLIAVLMPTISSSAAVTQHSTVDHEFLERKRIANLAAQECYREQLDEERRKRKIAKQLELDEIRDKKLAYDQWYLNRGIQPGPMAWFKAMPAMPATLKMILCGLLLSLPGVALVVFIFNR